jgi:uncharacterized protein YneF (UPF0154 family)
VTGWLLAQSFQANPDTPTSILAAVIALGTLIVLGLLFAVRVLWKQLQKADVENDELRVFMRDQMVPLLTRVNDVVVKTLQERAWDERLQHRRDKS